MVIPESDWYFIFNPNRLVWVVFRCTLEANFPFCDRMTKTSKNANFSSCSSSIVKFMFKSTLFK